MKDIETEVILLDAICSMIDNMVNHNVMNIYPDSNISFSSSAHAQLFNILLVDFLSAVDAKKEDPYDLKESSLSQHQVQHERSYLHYLIKISNSPSFQSDTKSLKSEATSLQNWLGETVCISKVWLPSIHLELDLSSTRYSLLKQSGTMAKHNPLKLNAILKSIKKTLTQSGHEVSTQSVYLALNEYQDWLSDHFFAASAGSLAVQLNNIRWSIHDYLTKEYISSYHVTKPNTFYESYSFHIPASIEAPIAKGSYWNLMNLVRKSPYIKRFNILPEMHTVFSSEWNKRNP